MNSHTHTHDRLLYERIRFARHPFRTARPAFWDIQLMQDPQNIAHVRVRVSVVSRLSALGMSTAKRTLARFRMPT